MAAAGCGHGSGTKHAGCRPAGHLARYAQTAPYSRTRSSSTGEARRPWRRTPRERPRGTTRSTRSAFMNSDRFRYSAVDRPSCVVAVARVLLRWSCDR
ncbi:hypothetical protein EVAR_92723_1 [Eumeta japonica]|uniref:Uncharacterized protein n=1 Tax=Eumeta variegata TaxID=151549 RepID=A0A4C1SY00_EUMVA|nr:hypothetical protein EVAR_92723_1 [Eumeta japonica]